MRRNLDSDGLFLHTIKPHSLDKILRHNFYARVFSTAMKKRWPQRAYVGLYSGPGRAELEGTGEIVETSAMGAVRLPDPFTHYLFVDRDARCCRALEQRIAVTGVDADVKTFPGDVNELAGEVADALPPFNKDKGLLSFCFLDPYAADLRFSTIRTLSKFKMDFLILLMLGRDVRTNFRLYFEDDANTRIADLIDRPEWRSEFRRQSHSPVRFLLEKFDEAMVGLGYHSSRDDLIHQVRVSGKNVFLYSLVFYSRHHIAQGFWRETLVHTDPQFGLGF